ncbi:hypothetical protein FKM82_007528 [Ascaphus truei]
MLPQGDGPGEELLGGDCHCRVISHSHSGGIFEHGIFIVVWDVADCPMQLPALAAHLVVLSLCQVRPPVLKWDSLFPREITPVPGPWTQCGLDRLDWSLCHR